jgi:hypothetical protein
MKAGTTAESLQEPFTFFKCAISLRFGLCRLGHTDIDVRTGFGHVGMEERCLSGFLRSKKKRVALGERRAKNVTN